MSNSFGFGVPMLVFKEIMNLMKGKRTNYGGVMKNRWGISQKLTESGAELTTC